MDASVSAIRRIARFSLGRRCFAARVGQREVVAVDQRAPRARASPRGTCAATRRRRRSPASASSSSSANGFQTVSASRIASTRGFGLRALQRRARPRRPSGATPRRSASGRARPAWGAKRSRSAYGAISSTRRCAAAGSPGRAQPGDASAAPPPRAARRRRRRRSGARRARRGPRSLVARARRSRLALPGRAAAAAALPVANPPRTTSGVTHAGMSSTGVREPIVSRPLAIPRRRPSGRARRVPRPRAALASCASGYPRSISHTSVAGAAPAPSGVRARCSAAELHAGFGADGRRSTLSPKEPGTVCGSSPLRGDDDVEHARAVHALDAVELDVGGGDGPETRVIGRPRRRPRRERRSRPARRHDRVRLDDADVVVGHERQRAAARAPRRPGRSCPCRRSPARSR